MMTSRNCVWTSLLIAVFTVSALGCASSGTSKAIGPSDLSSLAGKWTGTLVLPSGRSAPGTFELSPNGDYLTQASGFTARGKAQVKDGNLALVSTSTTGGLATGQRTSAASLSERADGMLVLTGSGHSDSGPFSFDVSRKK
ncbi:MAG: hypothetical protein ACREM3_01340 [Candidatus Rokuibacteriota bacterium]